jgi:hypothetical protein
MACEICKIGDMEYVASICSLHNPVKRYNCNNCSNTYTEPYNIVIKTFGTLYGCKVIKSSELKSGL